MSASRCRAAILISGSGSNLQSFLDHVAAGKLALDIVLVVSNRPDAYGLERARAAGVPAIVLDHAAYPDREAFDAALAEILLQHEVDLVVLAGFMRILGAGFVARFCGRILNIHPALLPAYPGLDTHRRVLDAGDRWHGSTVHFVTEELDGGPRILQGRVPVDPTETAAQLAARVQAVEHRIYPQAAALFASGRLRYADGHAWLDDALLAEPLSESFGNVASSGL